MSYKLDVDFSAYDPSNYFRSLRVHPKFGDSVRSFDELGTGQGQILILAFSYAYAQAFGQQNSLLLVIDEPESHLHPLAQQWLADRFQNLVTDGLQVVVTTHSPHFIDLLRPENLVIVSKPDTRGTRAVQVNRTFLVQDLVGSGAPADRTTVDSVGPFYSDNATTEIKSGLFARLCVFVEGPTESLAIPELLKLAEFECLKSGVSFVSVGGLSNIAKWLRLFNSMGVPCYCIFDTDSDKTRAVDVQNTLIARIDIMEALKRDLSDAQLASLSGDSLFVDSDHATISPKFELAANELFGAKWQELIQDARLTVGTQKHLQARYAAKRITWNEIPRPGQMALESLATRLTQLLLGLTTGPTHLDPPE